MVVRKPRTNKILYPEFQECSKFTLNAHWIQLFQQCSIGKFPKGLSYVDGKLCFKKKNIVRQFSIPKEPEKLYKTLVKIFREDLGLVSSSLDKKQLDLVESDKEQVVDCGTLADIKDKNIKYRMIFDYTLEFQKNYSLTEPQRQQLFAIICIGQLLKIIQAEQVEIKDYKIVDIGAIHYEDGEFLIDTSRARVSSSQSRRRSEY